MIFHSLILFTPERHTGNKRKQITHFMPTCTVCPQMKSPELFAASLRPSVNPSHWFVDNFFLFFWDNEMNLIKQVRIFNSLIQFHFVILLVIWKFLLGTNGVLQNFVSLILSILSHLLIRARGCLFKVWWDYLAYILTRLSR